MNKITVYVSSMVLVSCLLNVCRPAMAADARPAEQDEAALIAVLQSNAAPQEKAITCKRLAIYGGKAAVPVLAALLSDEKLASWARIGLEAIPDQAADDALRDALGKLQGKLLIGVVNSIGKRGDVKAIEWLSQKVKDADVGLASAAAAALGRIGGEQAAQALGQALPNAPAAMLPAICEGYLRNADIFISQGKNDKAAEIYDRVRGLQVPRHIRMEAVRGLIVAKQSAGIPVLVEQLRSDDSGMVAVAMGLAHEMPGAELTKALAAEVGKLPPEKQVYVIGALGVRKDTSVVPALVGLTRSTATNVCLAAIAALAKLADVSVLPQLVEIAVQPDSEISRAAQSAIAGFPSAEADATAVKMLSSKEPSSRIVAADIISRRATYSAMPAVSKTVCEDADQSVRVACINTLRELGGFSDLPPLVDLLLKNRSEEETQAAEKAMATICGRQTNAAVCADCLVAGMAKAQSSQKCALLRILRSVGDAKALQAVRGAMSDANAEVKDVATRLICDWNNADAADDMLALARNSPNNTYKLLGLRGYIRVSGGKEVEGAKRLAMCREAEGLIQRDDERKILLGVLGISGGIESFRMAAAYIDKPALKDEACLAVVSIAEHLNRKHASEVKPVITKVMDSVKQGKLAERAQRVMNKMK